MLGFAPEKGTAANLAYGKALMRESDHGSVLQMQRWWQDRAVYYAFETRGGAEWFGAHGGPPRFMEMVAARLPEAVRPKVVSPFGAEPKCYSCGESFGSLHKVGKYTVHRCTCGTKITHTGCFMHATCPICAVDVNSLEYEVALTKLMD